MKWNTCRSFSSLIPQAFSEYLSDARGFPNENNHFLFLLEDEYQYRSKVTERPDKMMWHQKLT